MIMINEIFHSIQGESTFAGLPCVFIRLTYCNLRCSYCDTEYAFYEGREMEIDEIIQKTKVYGCNLVEVTGGEPLMQKESLELMNRLCDAWFTVLLETGGSLPVENVDTRVKIIMDLKCPSSRMMKKNRYDNIKYLKPFDEVKFVLGDREDYLWAKKMIEDYKLDKFTVLFSIVFGKLEPITLAEWILADKLNVRFQLQLHKYIWEPNTRGV